MFITSMTMQKSFVWLFFKRIHYCNKKAKIFNKHEKKTICLEPNTIPLASQWIRHFLSFLGSLDPILTKR